jgi:hypothetical protein
VAFISDSRILLRHQFCHRQVKLVTIVDRPIANFDAVYFIYPETANVRLEDMNSIFGDATSVMPTPQTLAEAESLFSGDARSPVPSLDIRGSRGAVDSAIPGLNIDPPDEVPSIDGKVSKAETEENEGIGGWISNMVKRNGEGDSNSGKYKRVGQDEDET